MSVKVRELLEDKFFAGYEVLAGHRGLDREIQAVTLFDAPDGYKWYTGKEFVLSTGYLFKDDMELFKDLINHMNVHHSSALGIKVNRFLKGVPEEILALCDQLNLPLIGIPSEPAWIEIIDAVNAIVMNSFIIRMNNGKRKKSSAASTLFPEMQITEIIENLSKEIDLPVSIIDFLENKTFHYPSKEKSESLEKTLLDLLEPTFDYQKEKIYDKINIYRIRNLKDARNNSWIIIPIKVNEILVGNLIVWEMGKELGYYDFSALRLTFEILLYIYGQIYYMTSKEANFQDDFIQEILLEESDKDKLLKKAKHLGWDIHKNYVCISFKQLNDGLNLDDYRDVINSKIRRLFPKRESPLGLLEGIIIIFYPIEATPSKNEKEKVETKCMKLIGELEKEIPKANIKAGVGYTTDAFCHMKKSYMESIKTIEIGQYVYPEKKVIFYKDLGPFGFIHLRSFKEDFHDMIDDLLPIFQQEEQEDLVLTLKVFLDSKCNFNVAAKKLYIHNNTVRYRIAKIQQLCNIDLEDPTERLKLEIILKFKEHLHI